MVIIFQMVCLILYSLTAFNNGLTNGDLIFRSHSPKLLEHGLTKKFDNIEVPNSIG